MQLAKRTLAILIMILLSACGFEVDERIYGNWVEPLSGETIEFRADGFGSTMEVFGLLMAVAPSYPFLALARFGG